MRDHYDKAVARHLFEYLHYLNARFGVECARRFVGKQDIRVVHKCAGYCDALHLTTGHLVGLFAELIAEPHALKHRFGSAAAFGTVDARYRERKLNVCKHRLMRDEIVTLKNKADRMIAVCVPVAVAEGVCRLAVYFKLAGCISVKSADDIEKCGLAAARWTQHRHELAVTEGQGNALQRFDRRVARNIAFSDLLKCEHQCLRSSGVPCR